VNFKDSEFLLALLIVIVTALFMVAAFLYWIDVSFFLGPLRFSHWLAIIGTSYIAIGTPVFVVLKRYYPQKIEVLVRYHIYVNLLFFLLVSIHFAVHLGRLFLFFPSLWTGLAIYITLALEVISGFIERFPSTGQITHKINRFIHAGLIVVFFLVIVFHVLLNLGIL